MPGRGLSLAAWVPGLLLLAGPVWASHDWFGVDLCRSNPAGMPPVLQAAQLPQPESTAARLLADYCGQCHNLPHPGLHTAAEWRAVSRDMYLLTEVTARFEGRPGLRIPGPPERAQIDAYLEEQALRPLPEGSAAPAVYREVCGDCHAAPDPALYPRDEWPAVFARMAGHRGAMAREPLDPLRATRVLAYLSDQGAADTGPTEGNGRWAALTPVLALALFGLWRLLAWLRGRRGERAA